MHSRRSQAPAHGTSPAGSIPLRSSDDSCVILPRLGASDAAPAAPIRLSAHTTAPRLDPRKPPPPATAPRATAPSPQPATSCMHSRRSQAPAHSAAGHRCTQCTTEVQRRQLRHPSDTRCQRRCPIVSNPIVCTHHRPSARPSQSPHRLLQRRASPQHAASSTHSRRSHAPARSAAGR